MDFMRVLSIAIVIGLTSALLSPRFADARPVNGWAGAQGAPHGAWYAWRRNPRGIYGSWSVPPLGIYGYPYGDYLPYAGRDCFGSIRFKNAFCY
jgi:hypothetical protein